jgi:hypothetical protein
MADMLKQQDLLNELGVKSLDGLTEKQILNSSLSEDQQKELLTQMKLADVTDKLAKAAESLKNIFAGLATVFAAPIELITWLLNRTEALQSVIYAIGGYLGGKYLTNMVLGTIEIGKQIASKGMLATLIKYQIIDEGIITGEKEAGAIADAASEAAKIGQVAATGAAIGEQTVSTGLSITKSIGDVTSAVALSFGTLLPVILGGVAAAGALIYSFMDDGVVSPTGPSGYSRVLSGPEGSIALNDNDTIVAGTDLNSGGGGSNMSRVEALLEKLIAKVDQPVYITMGGKVIDEIDNRITLRKTYTTKVDSGYGVFG